MAPLTAMKFSKLTYVLSAAVLGASTHAASAADTADAGENKDILEILSLGGFMMYPLALLSIIAVVLIALALGYSFGGRLAARKNARELIWILGAFCAFSGILSVERG